MSHKEICSVFLILFYLEAIKSDIVPGLQKEIEDFVKIKKTNDKSVLKVLIDKSEEVYIFYPKSKNSLKDKATALYIAVSCKVANWNMNNIYEFVKFSPLFYQYNFQNYVDLYEKEFKLKFKSDLKSLVSFVDVYAEKFMNVLQNVLDTNADVSFYSDTSVLKSLISLRIKVNLMSSNSETPEYNNDIKSDFDKIRLLLEEMTTFQLFFSTYCANTGTDKKNSWFYGYWLQNDNEKSPHENPDDFFRSTRNLNLESRNQNDCLIKHMLLDIFISKSSINDCIGNEISSAKVMLANSMISHTYTSIKDVLNHIEISQDSETVFLYQDLIFAAVVKLIFSKTKKILRGSFLNTSVRENIDTLSKQISDDETIFPPYLAEGFRILLAYINSAKTESEDFKYFYDFSLDFIRTADLCTGMNDTEYLNELLTRIIENIDALKCFHKSYKYVHDERGIYYKSFAFNRSKNEIFVVEKADLNRSKLACNFVINLYSMCYQTLLVYSDDHHVYVTTGNSSSEMTFELLSIIRRYFLLVIHNIKRMDYISILKMAYTIAPLLVNRLERCNNIHCISDIKRILNIIMTNLNNNGLPYCALSKKNMLLFNNINFLLISDHERIEKLTLDFFRSAVNGFSRSDLISNNIVREDDNYLSIKYLKENFMNGSDVFEKYENRVQFYLSGQKKTVKEMFDDATCLLINSQNYYVVFDVYFKFYIAVIYYELRKIMDSTTLPKIFEITRASNALSNFTYNRFPPELYSFVSLIKNFLDLSNNRQVVTESVLSERTKKIDKKFKMLNIFLKDSCSSITPRCFKRKLYSNDPVQTFARINDELHTNLPVVTNLIEKHFLWKPHFETVVL